jgi:hypothetical protein
MTDSLKTKAASAFANLRPFMSSSQLAALATVCAGEEGDFFRQMLVNLDKRITDMPVTYDQDGLGDEAIVYLHYFYGGSDWYITEKDMDGGVEQAFGFVVLNGDTEMAELGYISIQELTKLGVELDLYFTPCRLGEIKKKLGI